MIDIVDIKGEVEQGKITAYVKDSAIYLRNDIGEVVKIGEVEMRAWKARIRHDIRQVSDHCGMLTERERASNNVLAKAHRRFR